MTSHLKIGGCVVFWKIGEFTRRSVLVDALSNEGMDASVPEPRTGAACLRDALGDTFPKKQSYKIFPKKVKDAFEVVSVKYNDTDDNSYETVLNVSIDKDDCITVRPYSFTIKGHIEDNFRKQLGRLRTANVGQMLVSHCNALNGTCLRPAGGLYWLPPSAMRSMKLMADAVSAAANVQGGNTVYFLTHEMNEDAVRAIRDAISDEVLAESARIHDEIVSGELGGRALKARASQAEALRVKIKSYDSILDCGLSYLKASVDKAEAAIAAGAVLEGAGA